MLARWTGLIDRSTSVNIRSEAVGPADLDLDLAGGGFLDIRCVLSDMDMVVCEVRREKEPLRVVCVNEDGLVSGGREGAIFRINMCGRAR